MEDLEAEENDASSGIDLLVAVDIGAHLVEHDDRVKSDQENGRRGTEAKKTDVARNGEADGNDGIDKSENGALVFAGKINPTKLEPGYKTITGNDEVGDEAENKE